MKKKRTWLALLLSIVMVISMSLLVATNRNEVAKADGETSNAIDLFTADSNATVNGNGVAIDTANDNVGEFNGVFSGDFELEYAYTHGGWGAVEFTFYDKDTPTTKAFSVFRASNYDNKGTAFVVDYRGDVTKVIALDVESELSAIDAYYPWAVANSDDSKEIYPNNSGSYSSMAGKLGLFFNDNSVDIKVSRGWNGEITEYLRLATLTVPNFSDGYIVKIQKSYLATHRSSENDEILISAINGNQISDGKISATTEYKSISYTGEYTSDNKNIIDLPFRTELNKFVCLGNTVLQSQDLGQFVGAEVKTALTPTDDYHDKAIGQYNLTVSHETISKDYVINVVDGTTVNKGDLFTESSNAVVREDGVAIDTTNGGEFNGVFSGDFEMEYSFTKMSWGETEIGFYDKDNPTEKVFSLYRSFKDGDIGTAFVIDGEKGYAFREQVILSNFVGDTARYSIDHFNTSYQVEAYPNNAGHYSTIGKLGVYFDGDTVTVKVTQGWGGEVTGFVTLHTMTKTGLSDGYIVKINALEYYRKAKDDCLLIHSVNGRQLDKAEVGCQASNLAISYDGENESVIDIEKGEELNDFTLTFDATVKGKDNLGLLKLNGQYNNEFALDEKYSEKAVDSYSQTVSKFGASKDYTINVQFKILTPDMGYGASIRIASNMAESGIRFRGKFDKANYDELKELATELKVGLIIVPYDYLDGIEFTVEALENADKDYVKLDCTDKMYLEDGYYYVNGALVGILEQNYNRQFASISYIEGKLDGKDFVKYGTFDAEKSVRSIVDVAKYAYEDSTEYTDSQLSILKKYIDGVVDVNIDDLGNVTYNNNTANYTASYIVEYNDGKINVTSMQNICVIIVNGQIKTGFTCTQNGSNYLVENYSL